jgi:hypothetical protein
VFFVLYKALDFRFLAGIGELFSKFTLPIRFARAGGARHARLEKAQKSLSILGKKNQSSKLCIDLRHYAFL